MKRTPLNLKSEVRITKPEIRAGVSKWLACLAVGGLLFLNNAWSQVIYPTPYTFTTIAGYKGNLPNRDGTGTNAQFYTPTGVTIGTNGNLYVVDFYWNTVRKIAPVGTNWVVTTIAGSASSSGLSTDGTNTSAIFNGPAGIAADGAGDLYVADAGDNVIRLMRPMGTNWVVTTIAGTASYTGGTNDGNNGAALFNFPNGIAVDTTGSNVYVADTDNNTIRWLAHAGTNWVVTTIAGAATNLPGGSNDGTNLVAQFAAPESLVLDASSNLYVADSGNGTIRKITPMGTNWVTTTIAGNAAGTGFADDGTNATALFVTPFGVAVDTNGNVFVADEAANNIRKLTPVGTNWVSSTLAGPANNSAANVDGTGPQARFDAPWGIAVNAAGSLFVADSANNEIRGGAAAVVPNLAISLTSSNTCLVSWLGYSSFRVLTNASLATTNWVPYGGTVIAGTNGINSVNLPSPTGTPDLFFRLSY